MISTKKLIQMAKKWQGLATTNWKRISSTKVSVADKGRFVVYTLEKRRFMIPLTYPRSEIIRELFRMAEEEFRMGSDYPIMLSCDSNLMKCVISILAFNQEGRKSTSLVIEGFHFSSSYSNQDQNKPQLLMLIQMAKKWQRLARPSRRRIPWSKPSVADKGHFVVYTIDRRRFMIPLTYLKGEILREL
ncbi:LOW QUALITY PROTEIN: hypothetical protein Cgig2_020756 [Carnegiea gigantea]|uniref:Uncharacterized protein n=1 Tax=Carnegiea gigantea TaxID=171969 RepID=A0A9Q1JK17_9CARY|nr:LOW QUALITY PROTEIN: hypothetical protein Cgig2_020756 [Carnegiea gigantea]